MICTLAANILTSPSVSAVPPTCTTAGGTYYISDQADLSALATTSACLATGLTFVQTATFGLSPGWTPIGTSGAPFQGTYDGNGYAITGLSVNSTSDARHIGLFGYARNATFKNIHLTSVAIGRSPATYTEYVGGIVGAAVNTDILDSSVTGTIEGINYVGGLVGSVTGESLISGSTSSGAVGGTDSEVSIGGIVGSLEKSEIRNVSSAARMRNNGDSGIELGGVVGVSHNSNIFNASATGSIDGGDFSGGLVGAFRTIDNDAEGTFTINNSHASGAVAATGRNADGVGGLVGKFQSVSPSGDISISVSDSYATGSVRAVGDKVGGLIGEIYLFRFGAPLRNLSLTVTDSYATGSVSADDNVGGLIGYTFLNSPSSDSTLLVNGSFATGDVRGNDSAGGLIGQLDGGSVDDSYARSSVTGVGDEALIGGLVGYVLGGATIAGSYATGVVSLLEPEGYATGGLFGLAKESANISRSFATGAVDGRLGENTGGLGGFFRDGTITESYATGAVIGGDFTGGLIGYSGLGGVAEISDSYAQGQVTGSRYVGSVVGSAQDGTVIARAYGAGAVSGTSGVGGAAGEVYEDGSITSVSQTHWNSQVTGLSDGIATITGTPTITNLTGLTTMQMRSSSSFTGWDFSSVWGYQCSSSIYPQLRTINVSATETSCLLPSPDNGGGDQPSPSPQQTIDSSGTPPNNIADETLPRPQEPGTASMTIGGQPVEVVDQRLRRGRGLRLSAGPVLMDLRGTTASGQVIPLAPDGSLLLARSGDLPVTASGLAPGSMVTQTLFSEPVNLGSSAADSAGALTSTVSVPRGVPLGNHTLTLRGTTNTGDTFTLNVGVIVATPAVALGADPILVVKERNLKGSRALDVRIEDAQAKCLVTFTAGKETVKVRAKRTGAARAQLRLTNKSTRTVKVTARVTGQGCGRVEVTQGT